MQVIYPLTIEDFNKGAITVISKVEIDSDGKGTFEELPDIKTYNISTNEENRVARFCSYSFNITCLNTDNRYGLLNSGSEYYEWLKQGRKIKLSAGVAGKDPFQLILGRIDNFKLNKRGGQDICTITGRCLMRMILDFKLYSPYTYWGTSHTYDTKVNQIRYGMEPDCEGAYRVFLDSTPPYDGSKFEEIYENTDWSYDWHNDQLIFISERIPDFAGTKNLKVYYFQKQKVEDVIADILIGSGILQAKIEATTISFSDNISDPDTILDSSNGFITAGFKSGQIITVVTNSETNNDGTYTISTVTPGVITLIATNELTTEDAATAGTVTITTDDNLLSKTEWLADINYVTPTGKEIDRVWFDAGTSALRAITLLSEVVQYRFYLDYGGNPIFKPKPSAGVPVNTISDYETKVEDVGENVDETYTHIIVIGEERDRIPGEDEVAPEVPIDLHLNTGMEEITLASLAWITAEWTANTESDFGHYELRITKFGYYVFAEVSTIATSFIWSGLDPGVEYCVQIRAVDIYNNRSEWSSVKILLTATDITVPAKITGAIATPLLAGIKVVWEKSMGTNIAGYIVEREESDDGTTWTGAWIERVRTDATNWMDLLLTYATYYRYKIKAFTQTGVEGPSSSPTQNSIKPNKAGTNDIVARSITGDQIAVNTIMANNYQELRNTYVHPGADSLDSTYPFVLDFEIVSEMTSINNVKLSFRISKFRAYSKGAASGGTPTSSYTTTPSGGGKTTGYTGTPSGGGQTSAAGGGQSTTALSGLTGWRCGWNIFAHLVATMTGAFVLTESSCYSIMTHSHYVYSHTHYVYAHTHPSHYHTIPDHTHPSHYHTIPNHIHNLIFGIYEETQSPTINVFIDNGAGYGSSIGAYTTDKLDINITGYISGTGFKRVKFTSNKRTRISAWVLVKIDLSA